MLGKIDSAIEDFNSCLNVDANLVEGWVGLGQANEKKGDAKAAEENYKRALSVDFNSVGAKEGLARLSGSAIPAANGGGLGDFLNKKWF